MTDKKNLWLWDIDGVIVHLTGNRETDPHLKAYKRDYREVLRIEVPDDTIVETYGMSEIEMHRRICTRPEIAAQLQARGTQYTDAIANQLTEVHLPNFIHELSAIERLHPLEGVVDFLTYLKDNGEHRGVVTGNLQEPARLILSKAGVLDLFEILSCDDGNSTRPQIVKRAIDEARNRNYAFDRIVVIGDTTRDIKAGKAVGAYTVGVATGSDSLEKLQSERPTIAVPSLKDYMRIVEAVRKQDEVEK